MQNMTYGCLEVKATRKVEVKVTRGGNVEVNMELIDCLTTILRYFNILRYALGNNWRVYIWVYVREYVIVLERMISTRDTSDRSHPGFFFCFFLQGE
jgi:hypothetical protein